MAVSFYRKIDVRVWGDERFNALSSPPPNAQTLWIYLLTGPHVGPVPGLFSVGRAGLAEALGWSVDALSACFEELVERGMAYADWSARVVFLPNSLKHSPPENPNQVRGWCKYIEAIPECRMTDDALRAFAEHLLLRGPAFWEPFMERFGERFPKRFRERFQKPLAGGFRKQDQDQDQEEEKEEPTPPLPPREARGGPDEPQPATGRRRPRAERQAAEAAAAAAAATARAAEARHAALAELRAATTAPEVAALTEPPAIGQQGFAACVSCGSTMLGRWTTVVGGEPRCVVVPQEPGGPCAAHVTASARDELLRLADAPHVPPSCVGTLLREVGLTPALVALARELTSCSPRARELVPVLDVVAQDAGCGPTLRVVSGTRG